MFQGTAVLLYMTNNSNSEEKWRLFLGDACLCCSRKTSAQERHSLKCVTAEGMPLKMVVTTYKTV